MVAAGFVLAGGSSQRMGRDKALLPYRGAPLLAHMAGIVEKVLDDSGHVAIVGQPDRYGDLGYRVLADLFPGCGPLGGIVTALTLAASDWNLMVACDMPNLAPEHLRKLCECAERLEGHCIAASGPSGEAEPLCAVYHQKCLPTFMRALQQKRFKLKDILPELDPRLVSLPAAALANLNTPEEWVRNSPDD